MINESIQMIRSRILSFIVIAFVLQVPSTLFFLSGCASSVYSVSEGFKQNDWVRLESSANLFIHQNPRSEIGYYYLALAYLNQQRYDEMNGAVSECLGLGDTYEEKLWRYLMIRYSELREDALEEQSDNDHTKFRSLSDDLFKVAALIPPRVLKQKNKDLAYFHFRSACSYISNSIEIDDIKNLQLQLNFLLSDPSFDNNYELYLSQSLQHLDSTLVYDSDNVTALTLKIYIYRVRNQLDKCIQTADQIHQLSRDNSNALLLKAIALDLSGNAHESILTYEDYLTLRPHDKFAQISLSGLYMRAQDYQNALVSFEKALILDSTNSEVIYNIAVCHFQAGQYFEAIDQLELIITSDSSSSALKYLAAAYGQINDFSRRNEIIKKLNRPIDSNELESLSVEEEQ